MPTKGAFVGIFLELELEMAAQAVGHLQAVDIGNLERGDGAVSEVVDVARNGGEGSALDAGDTKDGGPSVPGFVVNDCVDEGVFFLFRRVKRSLHRSAQRAVGIVESEGHREVDILGKGLGESEGRFVEDGIG